MTLEPDERARLDRLERQVRYLLRHLGISEDAGLLDPGPAAAGFGGAASGYDAAPVAGPVGVPATNALPPQLVADILNDRMIRAIKSYRELTGVGLPEAKSAVEAIARDLGARRR
jgi:ribosomal protein L7/L12